MLLSEDLTPDHPTNTSPHIFSNPEPDFSNPETNDPTHIHLSFQALSGTPSSNTFKLEDLLGHLSITILIDTDSSHNILQPRLANHLQLCTIPIPPFSVMVGNGERIHCSSLCPNVSVFIQHHSFSIPFYLIPIEGVDMVLGMDWLRFLGPLQADFSIPHLSFNHKGFPITLHGTTKLLHTHASPNHICQLLHNNAVASIHLLTFQSHHPTIHCPNPSSQLDINQLLQKYTTIFSRPHGLPPHRPHNHHIPLLPQSSPVNIKPYRYPHAHKHTMTSLIQEMLTEGIIRPSTSPFSSPVILIKKKDGTWHFCVDYRALNVITVKDHFPIPTIDELLDELTVAKVFTKLDLRSGYHQIRVDPKDCHKTAFRTFDGHYDFLVMPFGLSNAPSTFQAAMNDLLRPHLRHFVLVFFDDILIYSQSLPEHIQHLTLVLELLENNKFFVKESKCVFATTQVSYLGHLIQEGTITSDTNKIQAILLWPRPTSLTTLHAFLGITGFYRKFICSYATLASPLTDLLRLTKFTWTTAAQESSVQLKKKN